MTKSRRRISWLEISRFVVVCSAVLFVFGFRSTALAQDAYGVALRSGTRVRIRTLDNPERKIVGAVSGIVGDTLLVGVGSARTATRFPLGGIQTLEVRGGKDTRKGALIGAAALGGIGLVFGGIDEARGRISSSDYITTVIGNAAVGALIGFALAPTGWERVPLIRH